MANQTFQTVPNQSTVKIHREETGNNFIAISKHSFSMAYQNMSNSSAALGLYIWFVGNKDNYSFALSPQAIYNQLGMARSSYNGAMKKLIELKYLVKRENSNIYDFYEISKSDASSDSETAETKEKISTPTKQPASNQSQEKYFYI